MCTSKKAGIQEERRFVLAAKILSNLSNKQTHFSYFQRKSTPMPKWNPLLYPSLMFATSGTPKLISMRTGSNRYIRPTPADMEGFETHSLMLSARLFPVKRNEKFKPPRVLDQMLRQPGVCVSSLPALTNRCVFTGQCGFTGKLEMRLRPAAQ